MPYQNINKSIRDLRSLADRRDYCEGTFSAPHLPEYRHGGDRNRPTVNIANDPGALTAWCEAEGMDAAAVMGFAMWHAIRLWYRSTPHTAARSALAALVDNCARRLKREPTRTFSVASFHAVNHAKAQWEVAGRPLFDLACADAQRTAIGLRNVALRGGQ